MSGYRTSPAVLLLDGTGRPIGFKESDGDEIFFPTFNANQSSLMKPDGSAMVSVGGGGAAIDTLPLAPTVADSAVDTIAVTIGGVASQMTMENFVSALGVAPLSLAAADALAGDNVFTVIQGGVEKRTTLAALQSFLGVAVVAAPGAVTSLAAGSATTTTMPLTWVNSAGATGWVVKQRLAGGGSYVDSALSVVASATGATVSGLTASTAYDFQVFATNTGGTSPAATLLTISTAASGVVAPTAGVTSLAAGATTQTTIALTWVNAATATGWTVEQRLTGSGSYVACSLSVVASATGATVQGLTASTGYDFRVTAFNSGGSGPSTTLVNAITSAPVSNVYTITPFTPGNTVKTTLSLATRTDVWGTGGGQLARFVAGLGMTQTATYWNFAPIPASARCGWFELGVTPTAANNITTGQNSQGDTSINGLVPMADQTDPSFQNVGNLWVNVATGVGKKYCFWISMPNGEFQNMNPAGMEIVA